MIEEIMRMSERLIIAFGGILSIWAGYALFKVSDIRTDSGGNFKSALFNVSLTKVGPGVFFALFGAYILVTGLNTPVKIEYAGAAASDMISYAADLRRSIEKLPDSTEKANLLSIVNKMAANRTTTPPMSFPKNFYGIIIPPDSSDYWKKLQELRDKTG